jgi:D-3-phosphoglycerate dehydrogenase
MPLTSETRHMFGPEQFKRMKPTALLINVSRGGLVDEKALHTALSQGYIAGAGLDVTDPETPAADNPLLKLENALITPHTGYYSEQSLIDVLRQAEDEVFRVLGGDWPRNLVNSEVKEIYARKWRQT